LKRIILTREQSRNQVWAARLAKAGLDSIALPLVRFDPLPAPDIDPTAFDWVLLTSPQGARALAALSLDFDGVRFAALGHGTAKAIATEGWPVDFNAAALDGVEFVQGFLATADGPGPVLLPGPRKRLLEPRAALEIAGYTVREMPLYETLPTDPATVAAAQLGPDDVVFFCSPSAVRAFAAARGDKPRCVAIGRTTADACRTAGMNPQVADTPDLESMVRAAGFGDLPTLKDEPVNPELES